MIIIGELINASRKAIKAAIEAQDAAAIQQVAKTTAFRVAEASLLAPCTYSAIFWATLTGWLFWQELPTATVVAGTVVVVGSNLAIAWRERHR
jgi:drug/metabolite transporter (DMT)-like permease